MMPKRIDLETPFLRSGREIAVDAGGEHFVPKLEAAIVSHRTSTCAGSELGRDTGEEIGRAHV